MPCEHMASRTYDLYGWAMSQRRAVFCRPQQAEQIVRVHLINASHWIVRSAGLTSLALLGAGIWR